MRSMLKKILMIIICMLTIAFFSAENSHATMSLTNEYTLSSSVESLKKGDTFDLTLNINVKEESIDCVDIVLNLGSDIEPTAAEETDIELKNLSENVSSWISMTERDENRVAVIMMGSDDSKISNGQTISFSIECVVIDNLNFQEQIGCYTIEDDESETFLTSVEINRSDVTDGELDEEGTSEDEEVENSHLNNEDGVDEDIGEVIEEEEQEGQEDSSNVSENLSNSSDKTTANKILAKTGEGAIGLLVIGGIVIAVVSYKKLHKKSK